MSEYSDAQVIAGIRAALKASDMQAVAGLLRVLAAQAPREAAFLIDAIMLLPRATTPEATDV